MSINFVRIAIFLLIGLFVTGGAAVLQVFLSKSASKWPGLILPAVALLVSVFPVLNIVSSGNVWQDVLSCVLLFLLSNIPTVIFLAIYAVCRKKGKRKSQIDKMNIQDL